MTDRAFLPGTFLIPLVAEPEADIGALIVAVVLFALPVLLTVVAYALKAVPIGIVQSAGDHILSAEKRILGSLAHRVESAIRPFTLLVSTPVTLMLLLFSNIIAALSETRSKLNDIKRGTIPHYFHSALTWTSQRLADEHAYAQHWGGLNYQRILHYYNLAVGHTDHYFHSAVDYATRIGRDAEHYAHLHDTILKDEIIHYYGEAIKHADEDLNKALRRADVVKVAAETFTVGTVGHAVHYIEDLMSHRMVPLEAEADATKKKLQTWLDDCGDDLCNGLHDIAKDMPKLGSIIATGALLALLIEAVHNPEGTADFTVTDLYNPADQAAHALADVIGI